jgi:type II secretory pathway pseudopilin PulG
MKPRRDAAFTWVEAIVAIAIIGVLAALALPAITSTGCGRGGYMSQALSNLKQLHLATQSMELDGVTTGDTNLGWPGDTGGTFTNWVRQIVPAYLGTNDFCKLLSAPGVIVRAGKIPTSMSEGAVLVYAVSSNSPSDTVFLTTANFTNGPQGGKPLEAKAKPLGDKGFVVFRMGGDGAILLKNQATNAALIGKYAPLLK